MAVVSAPDRPAGRRALPAAVPVVARARERGRILLQPDRVRSPESVAAIAALEPDLGVVADYGQIIPRSLLEIPTHGILNVHPSLLPRHRGATPIPAAILAGDAVAGVTVIEMDPGLDTGPIVASESWPLTGRETAPELEDRAAHVGADLLRRTLPGWLAGEVVPRQQDDSRATLTRPLHRRDGLLDPDRPAAELERRVRGYQPWPGTYLETPAGRLIVWRAEATPESVDDAAGGVNGPGAEDRMPDRPGLLVADDDGLALTTAAGQLRLEEVQLAGRRRMRASELRRGHPELLGARVGPG